MHRDIADIVEIGLPERPADALESAAVGEWTVGREDIVLADDDGAIFVPAARACRCATRCGSTCSWPGAGRDPSLTFRDHLRAVGGAIEE